MPTLPVIAVLLDWDRKLDLVETVHANLEENCKTFMAVVNNYEKLIFAHQQLIGLTAIVMQMNYGRLGFWTFLCCYKCCTISCLIGERIMGWFMTTKIVSLVFYAISFTEGCFDWQFLFDLYLSEIIACKATSKVRQHVFRTKCRWPEMNTVSALTIRVSVSLSSSIKNLFAPLRVSKLITLMFKLAVTAESCTLIEYERLEGAICESKIHFDCWRFAHQLP